MLLEVAQLQKSFGQEHVLRDISFSLEAGHTLAVLGKSGSGKTTLLKILAGLEQPDTGAVLLHGQAVNDWPPQRRNMVYLYQEPLLFPHLDVFENIAFGLRLRRLPQEEITAKTTLLVQELGIKDQIHKMPHQLSGGQKQRVAFGRALNIQPEIILLDEPFGALDPVTRTQMQDLYRNLAKRHRISALLVTHDLKEALLMGDRWAVIQEGVLRVYPDRKHFALDQSTGVLEELSFWEKLKNDLS